MEFIYNRFVTHLDQDNILVGGRKRLRENVALLAEESVDSTFHLKDGLTSENQDLSDVLLLTNLRIIYLKGKPGRQRVQSLPLDKLDSLEVSNQSEGYGSLVWAALAGLVALMIWGIWDHRLAPVAALTVFAMGAYLVIDRLVFSAGCHAVISAGSSPMKVEINSEPAERDIDQFVDRIFLLRQEIVNRALYSGIRFPFR
jgi:hypothetical protein